MTPPESAMPPFQHWNPEIPMLPTWASRLIWVALTAGHACVLAIAAWLTPMPHGFGTHVQLGLPPCGFFVFTGYPCPGCGLTTAFAFMIRLQVADAFLANPFGVVLFTLVALSIPFTFHAALRGLPFVETLEKIQADRWAGVLALLAVVVWVVRLLTHA